jgi:hypothetical protein
MNVAFPKKVKVGSITYDIIFPSDFPAAPSYRGFHKAHCGIIEICDTNNYKANWKIFMHELTHAIDFIYCDRFFNEFEIELISNFIISLAIDNRFLFNTKKIPKSVRVFGISYDIVENYSFPELENTAAYVDHQNSTIYLADSKKEGFSDEFTKLQFLYCVVELLPYNIFRSYRENFSEDFPIAQFSNGLIEVFNNFDFEKALKEVFLK